MMPKRLLGQPLLRLAMPQMRQTWLKPSWSAASPVLSAASPGNVRIRHYTSLPHSTPPTSPDYPRDLAYRLLALSRPNPANELTTAPSQQKKRWTGSDQEIPFSRRGTFILGG